ncbi:DUF945 family protein [Deinococcus sp. A31D244]|uniref:DUF945 family protein n=1 Tax=Deinococcus sp. A31D244 TaxID=3397675 RepID=UPI0039E09C65
MAREPLARLLVLLNDAPAELNGAQAGQPDSAASDPLAGLSAAQQTQARADLLAVLQDNPVLTLDRLNVTQPAGNVTLTGRLALPGAARLNDSQLQVLSDQPAALLPLTDLQLKLSATRDALNTLLGNFGPLAQMADIDTLISAGYLTRSGNQLGLDLRFDQGRATLNGQSME